MHLGIKLLGEPTLALDGRRRPLAAAKTWALLGRVVIGPPITRRELATFLWPEANDPRAACRWTILQVRRALEPAATLIDVDDGLRLTALDGATVVVDVLMLHEGRTSIDELGTIGDVLLEGIDPRDAPEFEDWLRRERTRAVSALGATLRWSAAVAATTDTRTAIALARRAIVLDPFDDSGHEVLVSLLVAEGARADAEAHVRLVERRYRDDLGIDMPHVIRRGLDRVPVAGPGVRHLRRQRRCSRSPGAGPRAATTPVRSMCPGERRSRPLHGQVWRRKRCSSWAGSSSTPFAVGIARPLDSSIAPCSYL